MTKLDWVLFAVIFVIGILVLYYTGAGDDMSIRGRG